MVSVEVPGAVTGLRENVTVEPEGRPETDRLTAPAKPFTDDTVTVYVVDWPR